jgi:AcrR family transcriptional regulator
MSARLEAVDETRLRITEATVRLHERVGPAATTVSAVAEEAGVTRLTVYRHFPDDEALVGACSAHWAAGHPAPGVEGWEEVDDPVARVERALRETYDWWVGAAPMMSKIMRDLDTMPPFVADRLASDEATRVAALAGPFKARGAASRRVRAALAHALRLSTWQSLCADGGLTRDEAVRLMTATVRAATAPPR